MAEPSGVAEPSRKAEQPAAAGARNADALRRRNRRLMLSCVGLVAFMVAGSFASAPLYRLFCQVTGFGGTPLRAERAPDSTAERTIVVRFNADIDQSLPWTFRPVQREIRVKLGEDTLAFYTAVNRSGAPTTGNAMFNVTPDKAGPYFNKIDCFCFKEQTLAPGQSADMPVNFFVDPALTKDVNMDDVKTITLSYTFFRAKDQPKDQKAQPTRTSAAPQAPRPVN